MLDAWRNEAAAFLRERLERSMTESRLIHGIRVHVLNTRPDISTERVFRRAEAVLALVEAVQPWRVAHIRRDLGGILSKRFPCRAAYLRETRTCLLELTFMANESFSDAQVAASLVHEATHARLDRRTERDGIRSYEADPARHERICRRAELSFGLAVPDGGPVVARALESLAMGDAEVAPTVDWREAFRRAAAADADAMRTPGRS